MKKVIWRILKVLGMLIVVAYALRSVYHMSMVRSMNPDLWPLLVGALVLGAGLVYWAYRVIWCPIKPKKAAQHGTALH